MYIKEAAKKIISLVAESLQEGGKKKSGDH